MLILIVPNEFVYRFVRNLLEICTLFIVISKEKSILFHLICTLSVCFMPVVFLSLYVFHLSLTLKKGWFTSVFPSRFVTVHCFPACLAGSVNNHDINMSVIFLTAHMSSDWRSAVVYTFSHQHVRYHFNSAHIF